MTIKELCKEAHRIAILKGFWVTEKGINEETNLMNFEDLHDLCKLEIRNNGELIALMHSELSEALEALRYNNPKSDHIPEFSLLEEELADLLIRVGDFAEARELRLEEAIIAKMEYNKNRPFKHNKEF